MPFDPNLSVFAGMTQEALQAALSAAQTALIQLQTGTQVVTVSYGEGNGMKHVSYRKSDAGALQQLIFELQACLGVRPFARRAFGFSY